MDGQKRLRWGVLGLAVWLALGVSTTAWAADEYERIREKAAEMAVAVNGRIYDAYGEGKDSDLERAYGDFHYLLTPAKLKDMAALVAAAPDEIERERRKETEAFLQYHAMRAASAPLIDNTRDALRDNSIRVEEGLIVLRGLEHRIGREPDQDIRRKWALASSQLYTGINVYLLNTMVDLDMQAEQLGFEGYYDFLRQAQDWDLELLSATATTLLENTQQSYETALERHAQAELGEELRKVRTYDALRMLFFPQLSEKVEADDVEEIVERSLEAMGYDLGDQRNLRLDLKERDGKVPEAMAHQISPGKSRVTMIPTDYFTDAQDLMSAYGAAEFYHYIPDKVRFERAYFGTNILPQVYASLFALIAAEPAWIERHLELDGATAEEVASALHFRHLLQTRRAAGQFLFQLRLHENHRIDPGEYNEMMEEALVWRRTSNDAEAYLSANDDYRSGGQVLGAVIAVQIRDALRAEWGEEWFRNKELARRLKQGTAQGFVMPLDEFLAIWGLEQVDVATFAAAME